jgi:hypothetical protein
MLTAQFLALVISNSNMIMGGQGYCAFEFTLSDKARQYRDVEIVLRPRFNPEDTASGNTRLEDMVLTAGKVGRKRVKVTTDTDCNVAGFDVIHAAAKENGEAVDLIYLQKLDVGRGQLPISITGH